MKKKIFISRRKQQIIDKLMEYKKMVNLIDNKIDERIVKFQKIHNKIIKKQL